MIKRKLAVQLYSLREFSEKDFGKVLEDVAAMGYIGVEPAVSLYGLTPAQFKKRIADLGMEMCSSHYPWCRTPDDMSQVIDLAGELGLTQIVCGYGPDDFADLDAIKRTADKTNAMIEKAKAAGLAMFQHNHYWEFERINGELKYDIYFKYCPDIRLQLDSFWSMSLGANDPAEMMKHCADRVYLLHMKDGLRRQREEKERVVKGTFDRKIELNPLGDGEMDIPAILEVTPERVDTIIVELDYCTIEMHEALKRSYDYLVRIGAGYGSK